VLFTFQTFPHTYAVQRKPHFPDILTVREKKEWLRQYLDAETKKFSHHGQHLTWQAMKMLFGASNSLVQAVKGTPKSRIKGSFRNLTGHHTGMLESRTRTSILEMVFLSFNFFFQELGQCNYFNTCSTKKHVDLQV
jgi:hypothetical protein